MSFKQLILSMLIRIVICLLIFPFIPDLVKLFNSDLILDQTVNIYRIIFTGGTITMIILDTVFIGSKAKYEWHFILFSVVFLAMIFYKNFETYFGLTTTFLFISFFIFYTRIPLRKIILQKNWLSK